MSQNLVLALFLAALVPATADSTRSATATNALGLDLYRLKSEQPGNFLLSPYSIESALSMALGGADGATRTEMAQVLHLEQPDVAGKDFSDLRSVFEAATANSLRLSEQQQKYGGKIEPLQLAVANRLFGNDKIKFEADFLTKTQANWSAAMEAIPFTQPDSARGTINSWVKLQTHDRITDLIPPNGVNSKTALVIVNALYFKAAWSHSFSKHLTAKLPFSVNGSTPTPVATMFQEKHYGYVKEAGFTAVTVPYTGGDFQLLVVLPDAKDGLAAVEKSLTTTQLARLSQAPTELAVKLFLPKFKIEPPTLALAETLKQLGMKAAFDEPKGSADFSRMAKQTAGFSLAISNIFHKTFIAIDEEGTEAAAATAIGMTTAAAPGATPPPPVEVRVDRPFLFAIQHRESGTCLFLGRITDPRSAP
jgi:serpin B